MKEYTRDEVIEMLEYGCKDYANFTDQKLIEEWEFFFEENIKIED